MSVRKRSVKLGMAAIAVSGLVLSVGAPALADTVPDGGTTVAGTYTPGTSVAGVGSDTIQWVDDQLAKDYDTFNAAQVTKTPYWANFSACLGNVTAGAPGLGDNPDGSGFPCGGTSDGTAAGVPRQEHVLDSSIPATGHNLPNGSGSGRKLLWDSTDAAFGDVAYARSSGPLNTTDINNGLRAMPFAVDKIVVATHPGGPAPASLTGQQILGIYNGTYTNWNQVGGKKAPIHPYMPKSGSSTLNAFESFLASLDGKSEDPGVDNDGDSHKAAFQTWQGYGTTITNANWNTGSAKVEEHDPSVIIADPNAIEPFSYGRAQLANGTAETVRIEGGWSADRELYHVVRGAAISTAPTTTPFIWGDATTDSGGFLEKIFNTNGWICTDGTAQTDIANAGFWPLPSGASAGDCGVPNTSTKDTILPGTSVGVGEGAVTQTNANFFHGSVVVSVTSSIGTPTGSVQIVAAPPAAGVGLAPPAADFHTTINLVGGAASVKLPATVSGKQVISVSYLPTGFGSNGSTGHGALSPSYASFPTKVPATKVATSVKASATPLVLANSAAKTKITAIVKALAGSAKPTGTIKIMLGTKVIATGTLKAAAGKTAKVVITVKGSLLKKGKNKLVVKYVPKGAFKAPSKFPSVTITRKK